MFTSVRIAKVGTWDTGVDSLAYSGFVAEIAGNVLML
jgi:hypothetical protein